MRLGERHGRFCAKYRSVVSEERLQKILAACGVSSRRAAERLIAEGRVSVNGKVVRVLGTKADLARDKIELNGERLRVMTLQYYVLHKPRVVMTTLNDPEGRPCIGDYLESIDTHLFPVGRLDFHTSGALLITNDGELSKALLSPHNKVAKTYSVKVLGGVPDRTLATLERGVTLDDGYRTKPALVERVKQDDGHTWLDVTLFEGKNRQIHRMLEALRFKVGRLHRTHFAGVGIEGMAPGRMRPLTSAEITKLKRYINAEPISEPGHKPLARRARKPLTSSKKRP